MTEKCDQLLLLMMPKSGFPYCILMRFSQQVRLMIIERDLEIETRLVYFDALEKNAISSRALPASDQFPDVVGREAHLWGSQNDAEIDVFPSHQ